jgi:hypothetical protein
MTLSLLRIVIVHPLAHGLEAKARVKVIEVQFVQSQQLANLIQVDLVDPSTALLWNGDSTAVCPREKHVGTRTFPRNQAKVAQDGFDLSESHSPGAL